MNSDKKLKSIAFDLNTKALQEYYPQGNWHNGYSDIRDFMEENHFKHVQGSVYDSNIEMTDIELGDLIDDMCKKFKEWLPQSINNIRGYDQPIMVDYTEQIRDEYNIKPQKTINQDISKSNKSHTQGIKQAKAKEWVYKTL